MGLLRSTDAQRGRARPLNFSGRGVGSRPAAGASRRTRHRESQLGTAKSYGSSLALFIPFTFLSSVAVGVVPRRCTTHEALGPSVTSMLHPWTPRASVKRRCTHSRRWRPRDNSRSFGPNCPQRSGRVQSSSLEQRNSCEQGESTAVGRFNSGLVQLGAASYYFLPDHLRPALTLATEPLTTLASPLATVAKALVLIVGGLFI